MQEYSFPVMERTRSPVYFARVAIAGASLAASTWFLAFAPISRSCTAGCGFWGFISGNWLRMLVLITPLAAGLPISLWAEGQMKNGYLDEKWSEAELAPARNLLLSPVWKWLNLSILALIFLGFVFRSRIGNAFAFSYLILAPFLTVMRMRQMLTPRAEYEGALRDWRNFKPLQSDHWGGPVHSSDPRLQS